MSIRHRFLDFLACDGLSKTSCHINCIIINTVIIWSAYTFLKVSQEQTNKIRKGSMKYCTALRIYDHPILGYRNMYVCTEALGSSRIEGLISPLPPTHTHTHIPSPICIKFF